VTLTERLNPEQPKAKVIPFRPAWLRRMDEKGLPVQDRTAYILGQYVPAGSDKGA
jgi:hypothetical protein